MKAFLTQIGDVLGGTVLVALFAAMGIALFSLIAVRPLENRLRELDRALEQTVERSAGIKRTRLDRRSDGIDAFYRFFDRRERPEDWLAKIYGIAKAAGLELRTADYRRAASKRRLERYEITLPVTGTYTQIRAFLETALADVPIMSLDQVSYRRKAATDNRVDAQVVLTLYLRQR